MVLGFTQAILPRQREGRPRGEWAGNPPVSAIFAYFAQEDEQSNHGQPWYIPLLRQYCLYRDLFLFSVKTMIRIHPSGSFLHYGAETFKPAEYGAGGYILLPGNSIIINNNILWIYYRQRVYGCRKY